MYSPNKNVLTLGHYHKTFPPLVVIHQPQGLLVGTSTATHGSCPHSHRTWHNSKSHFYDLILIQNSKAADVVTRGVTLLDYYRPWQIMIISILHNMSMDLT